MHILSSSLTHSTDNVPSVEAMAPEKVTEMILNVDLKCSGCYKKVKKVICKMPQIREQVFDVNKNEVRIKVVCCSPENIRDKLCYKGGGAIQSIEIVEKPKAAVDKPKEPEKPKAPADKPKEPEKPKPKEAKPAAAAADKPKEPEKAKPAAADKPKEPEKDKPAAADKPKEPEKAKPAAADKPKEPEKAKPAVADKPKEPEKAADKPKEPEKAKPPADKPKEAEHKEPEKPKPADKPKDKPKEVPISDVAKMVYEGYPQMYPLSMVGYDHYYEGVPFQYGYGTPVAPSYGGFGYENEYNVCNGNRDPYYNASNDYGGESCSIM